MFSITKDNRCRRAIHTYLIHTLVFNLNHSSNRQMDKKNICDSHNLHSYSHRFRFTIESYWEWIDLTRHINRIIYLLLVRESIPVLRSLPTTMSTPSTVQRSPLDQLVSATPTPSACLPKKIRFIFCDTIK